MGFQTGFLKATLPGLVRCCFLNFILSFLLFPCNNEGYSYLCPNNRVKKKTPGNNFFLAARTPLKPKQCVCVYLLQGRESRVVMSEIKTSVGEAESGQVPQSQILWQWKTLGQTRLLTLIHQLLHLCVQTQICKTHWKIQSTARSMMTSDIFNLIGRNENVIEKTKMHYD